MKVLRKIIGFIVVIFFSCNSGDLKFVADLPYTLREVSGAQSVSGSDLIWMVNDAGNSSLVYGTNFNGEIVTSIKVNEENNDWEELTTDDEGNLYIGDFGNNKNKRRDLVILKIKKEDLESKIPVNPEKIYFYFPEQKEFPPKKKERYFDCEAFFYLNDCLYLFTKSRVEEHHGRTNLYKIPAKPGKYEAQKIGAYESYCNKITCWTTSADISPDKSKMVLLTPTVLLLFTDFKDDDFFNGKVKEYKFDFITQKESVFFKDNQTLYLADEFTYGIGGNLYEFKLH